MKHGLVPFILLLGACPPDGKSPSSSDAAVEIDANTSDDAGSASGEDAGAVADATDASAVPDAATETPDAGDMAAAGDDGPKIGGPLFLSIDGRSAQFNYTAMGPLIDSKFLKFWDIGNKRAPKPLIANEVYANLELSTAGKDLLDPTLTAADITEVALDITYSVDSTVAGGWGVTVENPASVPGAKFTFSNKGGKVSCHVEGVGIVKDVNKDKVTASPMIVFEANDLPGVK